MHLWILGMWLVEMNQPLTGEDLAIITDISPLPRDWWGRGMMLVQIGLDQQVFAARGMVDVWLVRLLLGFTDFLQVGSWRLSDPGSQ